MERQVDIDKAQAVLDMVQGWGRLPENWPDLDRAWKSADNSLLGLLLTTVVAGFLPNIPQSNEVIYGKFQIAFELGYHARAMQEKNGK
jgi:hypothetical protein